MLRNILPQLGEMYIFRVSWELTRTKRSYEPWVQRANSFLVGPIQRVQLGEGLYVTVTGNVEVKKHILSTTGLKCNGNFSKSLPPRALIVFLIGRIVFQYRQNVSYIVFSKATLCDKWSKQGLFYGGEGFLLLGLGIILFDSPLLFLVTPKNLK